MEPRLIFRSGVGGDRATSAKELLLPVPNACPAHLSGQHVWYRSRESDTTESAYYSRIRRVYEWSFPYKVPLAIEGQASSLNLGCSLNGRNKQPIRT